MKRKKEFYLLIFFIIIISLSGSVSADRVINQSAALYARGTVPSQAASVCVGETFVFNTTFILDNVSITAGSGATRVILLNKTSGQTLSTQDISGGYAIFNIQLAPGTYQFLEHKTSGTWADKYNTVSSNPKQYLIGNDTGTDYSVSCPTTAIANGTSITLGNYAADGGVRNIEEFFYTLSNPPVHIITVELKNMVNGTSWPNNVTFTNLTGTLSFDYYNITDTGFCVTLTGNGTHTNCTNNNGASKFYNVSNSSVVISSSTTIYSATYAALLSVNATRLYLNTSIANFNLTNWVFTNTTSTGTVLIPANNGSNNLKIDVAGNYTKNFTCTVPTPLTTVQCNATGIFDNYYAFNATDIWNNIGINNFSLLITNQSLGGTLYNSTTANGLLNVSLLQGYTYFIQFSTPNNTYELLNISLAANASNQKYTFEVLPAPSIDITIRDIETNTLITENVTIQLISNTSSETNYSVTGGFFYANITPGVYTIKLQNTNYSQSVYTISLTTGSVYYLTAYLQYAPETVTMQFVDSIATSVVLADVAVTQERVVNGSWQVISSKTTDITGRTTFRYADDVAYRFSAVVTNYASKTFTLDPILFDSYQIKMVKDTELTFEEDFQSVYLSYTPHYFYDGQTNYMNITFNSPLGTFLTYTYNVSYPGGNRYGTGANTVGETFPINLTIAGATYTDKVNVTLTYYTG